MVHQQKRGSPCGCLFFVVGAPKGASVAPLDGLSRRLHNQAKPSLNARIQASERRLLRERIAVRCRTQGVLLAHKEYNRSVRYCHSRLIFNGRSAMLKLCFMLLVWQDTASGMLHFPLEDRQARLSGEECGNIDAKRQNPRC